jgi:hypothetical protein
VKKVPAEVHDTILWNRNTPHDLLTQFNVKSYKSIKTAKGERLLIGYFEKLADVESAKKRTFQLMNQECRWSRYSPSKTCQQKQKKKDSSSNSLRRTIVQQEDHMIRMLKTRTIQKNKRRVRRIIIKM